ncbi:MAG: hypothetical protein O0X96_01980, partial [Methanocorpusculum sp.]|nr:hypothetical protein [Methanocorpusculum sp.]
MKSICVLERVFSALPINSVLRRGMFAAAVLLLFAVVCAVPAAASADDAVVFDGSGDTFDTAEKLAEALGDGNAILSGDSTLKLLKDIKVTGTINITGDMTILSDGITIWRGKNDITLIEVTGGALTLGDGSSKLTIDGQKDIGTNKESLISIRNGASCTMNAGVTLTNNYAEYGGGVFVNDGSTFEMSGDAKISGNIASYAGGGVYVTGRGTFTMYSGTISDNNAAHGGGVYGNMGSTFTMTSGEISDNKAGYGGGVFVNEGTLTIVSCEPNRAHQTGSTVG